jgi:hypothetical protein
MKTMAGIFPRSLARTLLSTMIGLASHAAIAFTANDGAKTISTDGSFGDTTNAVAYVDAKNQDGWVVTVGSAGGSYTWSSPFNFNIGKQWVIQGASSDNRPTIILRAPLTFTGGSTSSQTVTIKDFIFSGTSGALDPMITLTGAGGATRQFRMTNCKLTNTSNYNSERSLFVLAYGLIDHCDFEGGPENRVWCRNDGVGWTGTMTFGTEQTICIEDCVFTNTQTPGSVVMSQVLDGDHAMRVTFRHNTITNGNTETHGYTSGAGNEGLQAEIYSNQFYLVGNGLDCADWATHIWRGGTGVCYSNTVTLVGFWGANFMSKFRAEQPESYPAPHQPGQGLIAANTLGRVPIYFWNNNWPGGTMSDFGLGEGTMVVNVDYYTNTPKPGYTALVYPHPLQSGEPISAPQNLHLVGGP